MKKHEDKNAADKGNTPNKTGDTAKPVVQDKSGSRTTPSDKKAGPEDRSNASRPNLEAKEHQERKRTK